MLEQEEVQVYVLTSSGQDLAGGLPDTQTRQDRVRRQGAQSASLADQKRFAPDLRRDLRGQLFEMALFSERWLTNALQEEVDVENHDEDSGEEASGR